MSFQSEELAHATAASRHPDLPLGRGPRLLRTVRGLLRHPPGGERRREESSPFEVSVVAERAESSWPRAVSRSRPTRRTEDCPSAGRAGRPRRLGRPREIGNRRLLAWIAGAARGVETLASVCTGSMLLGEAGLLDDRRATTHWKSLALMRESFPGVRSSRTSMSSRTATSSRRRASRPGSTWRCGWSPATMARRSRGRRPATWNTATRTTTRVALTGPRIRSRIDRNSFTASSRQGRAPPIGEFLLVHPTP